MRDNNIPAGLDANPTVPLYRQIKHLIAAKIDAGLWTAGDKIPTEHQLVDDLKASRMTVNRALRELTQEGVLIRRQGSGTFVSPSKLETGLLEIRNISEVITARGHTHSSDMLVLEKSTAPEKTAQLMGGQAEDIYFHSLCLHFENAVPLQLEDRYVNPDLVPHFLDQDFSVKTTGGYLLENIPYTRADHKISAAMPTLAQRGWLNLSASEPVLVLQRLTYCSAGVITSVCLYHPASRYEIGGTFIPDRESNGQKESQ